MDNVWPVLIHTRDWNRERLLVWSLPPSDCGTALHSAEAHDLGRRDVELLVDLRVQVLVEQRLEFHVLLL